MDNDKIMYQERKKHKVDLEEFQGGELHSNIEKNKKAIYQS